MFQVGSEALSTDPLEAVHNSPSLREEGVFGKTNEFPLMPGER